jgi:hypothetical protein
VAAQCELTERFYAQPKRRMVCSLHTNTPMNPILEAMAAGPLVTASWHLACVMLLTSCCGWAYGDALTHGHYWQMRSH